MNMESVKPTVLVVDDVAENIDVLAEALSAYYEVKIALNGEDALDIAFSETTPDLVLLDIMMPGMDGYEVCRRLKEHKSTRELPVIFVTAMGELKDETRGFEVGGVDYITKPISTPKVLARVKAHLELKMAREELKEQNEILSENLRLREDVESIIRHDLKTPVNVLMWGPDIVLSEGNLSDNQVKTLNILKQSAYTMLKIINTSINLVKMERGEYEFHPAPVNIIPVLQQIKTELLGLLRSKHLQLDINVNGAPLKESDVFLIEGEEILFYSMLNNLVKNALEASPSGESVSVSLGGKDNLFIRIHNMGAVPEEIRERFFDKYVTSHKGRGAGLGTYSARLIAETQSGVIQLDTSEDKKTTVTISFPKRMEKGTGVHGPDKGGHHA